MNKKDKIILLVGLISILALFIFFFNIHAMKDELPKQFVEDPSQMFKQIDKETVEIDVHTITDGNSEAEGFGREQIYLIEEGTDTTLFSLQGVYLGKSFTNTFFEEEVIVMRISKQLKPNNGIIEGYIAQRIEDEQTKDISSYIFLDEDWKKLLPNTRVFWGSRYQYNEDYDFNEISEGIYMMKIKDDPNRFFEGFRISSGGIAVGDLIPSDISENNIINRTFMRLYS